MATFLGDISHIPLGYHSLVEEWVEVTGVPGLYISCYGRTRTSETILRQNRASRYGHRSVHFGGSTHLIHRLVCEAFNGPAPEGKTLVAHRDGDPHNNHSYNLRWATPQENMEDRVVHWAPSTSEGKDADVLLLSAEEARTEAKAWFLEAIGVEDEEKDNPVRDHQRLKEKLHELREDLRFQTLMFVLKIYPLTEKGIENKLFGVVNRLSENLLGFRYRRVKVGKRGQQQNVLAR